MFDKTINNNYISTIYICAYIDPHNMIYASAVSDI